MSTTPSPQREDIAALRRRCLALLHRLRDMERQLPHDDQDGATLALRRMELGLSQRDLAQKAHVSRGLVSDLESGRRTSPFSLAQVGEVLTRLEGNRG
jgi:predicted transcriptional regulator